MSKKYKGILSLQFLVPNVLLLAVVAVAVIFVYKTVVLPRAEELSTERVIRMRQAAAEGRPALQERSVFLIIKDPEPMFEVIFFTWGMLFLAWKMVEISRERRLLHRDFMHLQPSERIIPEHAAQRYIELKSTLENEPRLMERMLPQCLLTALHRFNASGSIQDAATAVREKAERTGDDLDSSLGLVRYIAWAIPAIGFVGTVRGIGEGLNHAEEAIKGDLSLVTTQLGLAFNSTLVGLMLCVALMYCLHACQGTLESLISQIQRYCDENVIDVMRVPAASENQRPAWEYESKSTT